MPGVRYCVRLGRSDAHPADQEGIANLVYGGAWGRDNLGNAQPGDGWRYRGSASGMSTAAAPLPSAGTTQTSDVVASDAGRDSP